MAGPPPGPRVLLTEDRRVLAVCPSRAACLALSRAIGRGITAMPRYTLAERAARRLPDGAEHWDVERLRAWAASTGDVVEYDHPDWGLCRGRVLDHPSDDEVLVQDLAPNGARERWPLSAIRMAP